MARISMRWAWPAISIVVCIGVALIYAASGRSPSVKLAPGWNIELVAQAPEILFPTAIVTAPDGTIYLGQDPMDMPGPATTPADSVVSIKDGRIGGAGAQGLCYNEDGLAEQFRGNLFFCDWGLQAVIRYEVARIGGTFAVKAKEYIARKGTLGDFRPFSLAVGDGGNSLYLVDWGFNGFLVDGPKTGRLYRLSYSGRDCKRPSPQPTGDSLPDRLAALQHPALSVRLAAGRALAARGAESEGPLIEMLQNQGHQAGRLHALWALDSIGTTAARRSIRKSLADSDVDLRAQAARSVGIHRDPEALPALTRLLGDPIPLVRREAAIALGRIASPAASPSLLTSLGDPDRFTAWSIRRAIRAIGVEDAAPLAQALGDSGRRDAALLLCNEWWSVKVARALVQCLGNSAEPAWRGRVVTTLAGLYRRYPEKTDGWFGPNPLAGEFPGKTQDWDASGMSVVFEGLAAALLDEEPSVRRHAIAGLTGVGERAVPALRIGLAREPDPVNLACLARALGDLHDSASIPNLIRLLADPQRPNKVREAALESLIPFDDPAALAARLAFARDPMSPVSLVARAIASSGRCCPIPQSGLADFLGHPTATVRVAALESLATLDAPSPETRRTILDRLNDTSRDVRLAAIGAIAALKVRESIPRLLDLARDENYRAAATKALAGMPDPRALPVYLEALDALDPEARQAGEDALHALRDSVRPELESRLGSGQCTGPAALAVERILARFHPVTEWKLIGPFPRNAPPMFTDPASIDFARAHLGEGRSVSWTPCRTDPKTGRVLVDDLKNAAGDPHRSGYDTNGSPDLGAFAYTEILADRDRPILMKLGSSGTITVTANGSVAFHSDHQSGRAYSPDSDTVRLILRKGINRIVVRTRQGIGVWSFSLQLAGGSDLSSAPSNDRTSRDELRDYALTHPGDAKKGEAFFFDPNGVGCVKCHAAAGRGTSRIGPDLSGLALKYDKAEIIRSVLDPSNRIASGYLSAVVARTDGTVSSGLLRGETNIYLDLIGSDLEPVRVAKSDIDVRRVSETSLMPSGLVDSMTKHEFADLIAYLISLTERPAILEAAGPIADPDPGLADTRTTP